MITEIIFMGCLAALAALLGCWTDTLAEASDTRNEERAEELAAKLDEIKRKLDDLQALMKK
jgi:hypothetical protein